MWVKSGEGIKVAKVYILIEWLENPEKPYVIPTGYAPGDWTGFYLYIGIEAIPPYQISTEGNKVHIDWDQDDYIDFQDENGNSRNPANGFEDIVLYGNTPVGTEWAIPYSGGYTEEDGFLPFDIYLHIDSLDADGFYFDTATFPNRVGTQGGQHKSTTIFPGDPVTPPEPPEPSEWGIRTIGFWKHQFRAYHGFNRGHQHVDDEILEGYIDEISSLTTIPEYEDLTMMGAWEIIDLQGKQDMEARLLQQLLATWLNYVSGNTQATVAGGGEFDDYAGTYNLLTVILEAEAALEDGDLEYYKNICDAINNSGPE
jgi:hypothetical protein